MIIGSEDYYERIKYAQLLLINKIDIFLDISLNYKTHMYLDISRDNYKESFKSKRIEGAEKEMLYDFG